MPATDALNKLLSGSAGKYARQPAVEDLHGLVYSYSQLQAAAAGFSALLSRHGVGAGCRVGILAPKSPAYVVAIFGILETGAAYVPMDIKAPVSRNISIFLDCGLQAVLMPPAQAEAFRKALGPAHNFEAIPVDHSLCLLLSKDACQKHHDPLAYIIYTSGSTGTPKGVMHTHNSAMAFISWSVETFSPAPGDRFISHAPFHFDLSIFDLFVAIATGGTLVLTDEKTAANSLLLAAVLALKKINILYATPSTLSYLCLYGKMHKYDHSALKLVLFAGEVFPIDRLKAFKAIVPQAKLYNLYGPTETNVCTWYKVPQEIPATQLVPFPIGEACNFAEALADQGELLVAGKSLMCGYWNDADKTSRVLHTDERGVKWYRTGDLVTTDQQGQLVYAGRKDRMVKRRGYRIEPGEIENTLLRHEAIWQVAVTTTLPNDQADATIRAHIAWKGPGEPSAIEMAAYCREVLPEYMIPDSFMFYEQLPQTSTNKIDYKALTSLND